MHKWLSGSVLGLWLWLWLWQGLAGAQPSPALRAESLLAPVPEATMKAHYVLNVMRYVTWPADLMPPGPEASLTLCVLGTDGAGTVEALMALNGKRGVQTPRLTVQRVHSVRVLHSCHAVFVAESDAAKMDHILGTLGSAPVLVVADSPAARQATVVLALDNRRLVFDINLTRAKASQLQVSSKLMQLARSAL